MHESLLKINKEKIKGITIVSLVVTIIVLLILAGVAINFTIGEDGIFKRAQNAAKRYENAQKNEEKELQSLSNYIDNVMNENNISEEDDDEELITNVKEAIQKGKYTRKIQLYMMNIIIK